MVAEGHSEIHYGSLEFTYDDKDKAEFIEWTEKNIHDEICVNLQRHLTSKSVLSSDVVRVQAVVGGDHGNTAFQFGAKVSVHLRDNRIIHFEVMVCELICRKDTAKLIESTILQRLTNGLEIVATWHLHTTSPVTIENPPDRGFRTGSEQAANKFPTTSVLFDVGIVEILGRGGGDGRVTSGRRLGLQNP
jgi:hypothetical protein